MSVRQWNGAASAFATSTDWTPNTTPVSNDDVYYDQVSAGDCAGSNQSAIVLTSFNAKMTDTYNIGTNGTPLQIGGVTFNIGQQGDGSTTATGSGRINLDAGTGALTLNVYDSGTSTDNGKETIRFKAVNAANVANIFGGLIGFATDSIGDAATFGTINITGSSATVYLGSGLTLSNLNISNGTVVQRNTVTNVSYDGGSYSTEGTYNIPTLNVSGSGATLNHRRALTTVAIARSSQVATVTWTSHGLSVGDLFQISAADQFQYNGIQVVESVVDANNVTFHVNGTPTTPATGTITANLMAVTTLNLFDGAVVDVSNDARPFAVGTLVVDGDATIITNPANPNHFQFKYKVVNRGTLTTQA